MSDDKPPVAPLVIEKPDGTRTFGDPIMADSLAKVFARIPEGKAGAYLGVEADKTEMQAWFAVRTENGWSLGSQLARKWDGDWKAGVVLGKAFLAVLALVILTACQGVTIPPCILDGSCLPTPPASPSPVPSPTPAPPSPTPPPVPSPSPSATPTPSPAPTPTPTPTPVPTPQPTPSACPTVPADPVPLVYADVNLCPAGLIPRGRIEDGRKVCVAETYCGRDNCPDGCKSAFSAINTLRTDADFYVSPKGYVCDNNGDGPNWCQDAYGRKYAGDEPRPGQRPFEHSPGESGPWAVLGNCEPAANRPCSQPTPTPTPTPVATPAPSPSPGDGIIPKLGECPAGWPIHPDFVTIGEKPWRAPANKYAWIFNVTPRRSDPRYCLNEKGISRGVPCEEWIPCALRQDARGNFISQVSAKAWGPGGFNGDDVERRSGNPNLLNMVLGPDGSPPGTYEICVAPTDRQIKTGAGMCRTYHLTLPE